MVVVNYGSIMRRDMRLCMVQAKPVILQVCFRISKSSLCRGGLVIILVVLLFLGVRVRGLESSFFLDSLHGLLLVVVHC